MAITNPPGAPAQMQAVVHLANNCIKFAEEVCDAVLERQTPDPNTNLAGIAGACIARGAQALMSTTELAQRGFIGDALTVARTIVELAIDLGYIESDAGTLIRRFRDYADVRNREMAEAINELYGGNVSPAAMQVLRDRAEEYIGNEPNSEYSWAAVGRSRRGVGWRAERVAGSEQRRSDYRRMYALLYGEMCGASHSGAITLEYTMTNGAIQFGPQAPSARPVRLAAQTLLMMIRGVLDACAIEGFDERHSANWEAIAAFGR